jgi:cob(I)alamin adenosyltransferase
VESRFNKPRVAINRVYTRLGDSGETKLVGGQKVSKGSLRLESYGTVDELNAFIGMACQTARESMKERPKLQSMVTCLVRVQHELFNLGGTLATLPGDIHPRQPRVTRQEILRLERDIDETNQVLSPLRSFVLPGGNRLNVELHLCRTICRRAERYCIRLGQEESIPAETVQYLNRLGDALFVWSRWVSHLMGTQETLWDPNQAGSD